MANFRTFCSEALRSPSPNLLDTIYGMQSRQEWMRECLTAEEAEPVSFVGFLTETETVKKLAQKIREKLGLDDAWVHGCKDAEECFAQLRRKADEAGILVFTNGIVGNNTRRTLDHEEFRGFVLADESFKSLAKHFGVSTLVIARRALAHNLFSKDDFFAFYEEQQNHWEFDKEWKKASQSGGDFYNTM